MALPPAAWQQRHVLRAREFPDLPPVIAHVLVDAGFTDRAAVAAAPDAVLLALPGLGPTRVETLRAILPAPTHRMRCAHCGGTGWEP